MALTREDIITAVLARLSQSGQFDIIVRRLRDPETIGGVGQSVLALLMESEQYDRPALNQPPRRTMNLLAVLFYDVGTDENAVPAAKLNALVEVIEAQLAPDNPLLGTCTLGGRVTQCMVSGKIEYAPGEITGRSTAVVPISVLIP